MKRTSFRKLASNSPSTESSLHSNECRFLLVASALLAAVEPAPTAHYHIYLLGGQSNASGRADAAPLTEPLASPQTDVAF